MDAFPVLVFVTLFIVLAAAGEPRCSSFDYEQKTLEKMIRTEIKCEEVISEVRDVKELVKQELENVKAEKVNMLQEIQTVLAEVSLETKKMKDELQTSLAQVSVETKKMKDELSTSLAEVVLERAKIKDEIQTAVEALKPTVVTFKAKMAATVGVNKGTTLIFQDVVSNHGNGYDATKGMFRAPVGGIYLLTLKLCVFVKHVFVLETVIDDIAVSHALMYDYGNHVCHDHTDLVTLEANSTILYRSGSSSSSSVNILVSSTQWTSSIAGVLLFKQ